MEISTDLLRQTQLFESIDERHMPELLACLNGRVRRFKSGSYVKRAGDSADSIGVVLAGGAIVLKDDFGGNRAVVGRIAPGDVFGEVFCCAGLAEYPVDVKAEPGSEILLVDYKRILTACGSSCKFKDKLVENMLRVVAQKTLGLNERLDIVSRRSTREKLLAFLYSRAAGQSEFTIEFDRQQLADYLGVDRSAMSNELSKLAREGALKTRKNRFWLRDVMNK